MSETDSLVCDSIVWNGWTLVSDGLYDWTGVNEVGCDSTAWLDLEVHPSYDLDESLASCVPME